MKETNMQACPRIYTRCPACHNDTLTINKGHLLCTWHVCPDPTRIDRAGEREPEAAQSEAAVADSLKRVVSLLGDLLKQWQHESLRHRNKKTSEPVLKGYNEGVATGFGRASADIINLIKEQANESSSAT